MKNNSFTNAGDSKPLGYHNSVERGIATSLKMEMPSSYRDLALASHMYTC